jgi:hypothetical protein
LSYSWIAPAVLAVVEEEAGEVVCKMAVVAAVHLNRGEVVALVDNLVAHKDSAKALPVVQVDMSQFGMSWMAAQVVRLEGVLQTPERYREDRKALTGCLRVEEHREKIEMFSPSD